MKLLLAVVTTALVTGVVVGAIVSTPSDTTRTITAKSAVAVPTKQTFYYQVSAVNSVGEGPKSNEVKATVVPLTDFQQFVTDAQGATYYSKWAHDNPNDLARWVAYRDAILASQTPTQPTMSTKYGAGLVDAGKLFLDYALGS